MLTSCCSSRRNYPPSRPGAQRPDRN
jgi:hypothetical protein